MGDKSTPEGSYETVTSYDEWTSRDKITVTCVKKTTNGM